MEKEPKQQDAFKIDQQGNRNRQRRFQAPRRDADEDPGKDIWYMGF